MATTTTKSPFHYEALVVVCSSDQERPEVIREVGKDIYAQHKTTTALRQFIQASIQMKPELTGRLLRDFNSALDGIGNWLA